MKPYHMKQAEINSFAVHQVIYVKLNDTLMYPFIIPPFSDREQMWRILLRRYQKY